MQPRSVNRDLYQSPRPFSEPDLCVLGELRVGHAIYPR